MIPDELLQSFIAEASDLLDDVEPALVEYPRLKDVNERMEVVNRVFRHFHSIKGSAGFVGLHNIARLTHEAETLLEQFRKSPDKIIPQENITLLCGTVDLLRAIFASGGGDEEGSEGGTGIDSLIRKISGATYAMRVDPSREMFAASRNGDGGTADGAGASPGRSGDVSDDKEPGRPGRNASPPRPDTVTASRKTPDTVRIIHTGKPMSRDGLASSEFAGRYVSEANELIEQIEQALLQAEQHPESSADAIQEAFRCLHSFKGNSGFMNLADLERLSHRMEAEVESTIGRSLGLDSQTFDALLQMVDVLRQGVTDFSCGGSGSIPEADSYIAMMDEMAKAPKPDTGVAFRSRASTRVKAKPSATAIIDVSPASAIPPREGAAAPGPKPKTDYGKRRGTTRKISISRDLPGSGGHDAPPLVLRGGASEQIDLRSMPKADNIAIAMPPPESAAGDPKGNAPGHPAPGREAESVRDGKKGPDAVQKRRPSEHLAARNDIRVDLRKLDEMLNLVGELVIAEAMVTRHPVVWNAENESLERAVHQLRRVAGSLQDMATSVRMIPLAPTFRRMTRLVYDLSVKAGKQIDLILLGEETEVDRTVIERISDPMVHIIRNAIDHGIEPTAERIALGKPETGRLTIEGHHEGGEVWIVITDDGRGLNKQAILQKAVSRGMVAGPASDLTDNQIYHFVFEPGFSTATKVTDISGRGFGMDVVKKNIEKLSGKIDIRTRPGEGTAVVLRIPLTLAIIEGMLIRSGDTRYIIPLLSIRESLRPDMSQIMATPDGQELVKIREELIPIVRLDEAFSRVKGMKSLEDGILMIVEGEEGDVVALFADELLGQQETVIKGLSGWLRKSRGVSGCTILGDGEVGLILDIGAIVRLARQKSPA